MRPQMAHAHKLIERYFRYSTRISPNTYACDRATETRLQQLICLSHAVSSHTSRLSKHAHARVQTKTIFVHACRPSALQRPSEGRGNANTAAYDKAQKARSQAADPSARAKEAAKAANASIWLLRLHLAIEATRQQASACRRSGGSRSTRSTANGIHQVGC